MKQIIEKWMTGKGFLFGLGLAAVLLMYLPLILLGESSIVTYHDQLDGELIAYMLQARHLTDGNFLPEFMGGVSKTVLTPPAPAFVLWFVFLPPFLAYLCMQLLGSLTAYGGMYLLAGEVTGRPWIKALVGLMFAALPFLPVYGLSQFGIPLLVWCAINLWKGEKRKRSWLYCILFALHSSLVLVGFAILGLWGLIWLASLWKNRENQKNLLMGVVLMLALYIGENLSLLGQILGGGWASHKEEYHLVLTSFLPGLAEAFLLGGQHSTDQHLFWLLGGAGILIMMLLQRGKEASRDKWQVAGILGSCTLLALTAALWKSPVGLALRNHMAALGAFQVERVLWVSPTLWYLLLAVLLERGRKELERSRKKPGSGKRIWILAFLLLLGGVGVSGISLMKESSLRHNVTKLIKPEYKMMTYGEYYGLGVMNQVRDFLEEYTGEDCEAFRVVSLGIDPAAALYEGFYCLDGYSNNYPLSYKHDFRRIIAPELEKSSYLKEYFDGWGNRCYLLSSEAPAYYTIEKGGFFFQNLELDTRALRELGGRFVLSAAYIANSEKMGLSLLREEAFETEDSYYRIFVYEVNE